LTTLPPEKRLFSVYHFYKKVSSKVKFAVLKNILG